MGARENAEMLVTAIPGVLITVLLLIVPFYFARRLDQIKKLLTEIRDNAVDAESKRRIENYQQRAATSGAPKRTIPGIND